VIDFKQNLFALYLEIEGVLPWLHDMDTYGPLTKVIIPWVTSNSGQMGQPKNA
jgi:hypothetical protein